MATTYPLGYITPADRTPEQMAAHADALALMHPRFAITGTAPDPGPRVDFTDLWKHADVVAALGFAFTGTHQLTGSCVGAGGGNVLMSLVAMEVLRLGDPEQIILPFWLFDYGISRWLIGDRGEGEGSLGSAFARACREYGVLDQREAGLPQPQNSDGLVWGERVEMTWSAGDRIDAKWQTLGKRHLVKSTAPIKSADEARAAIRNGYPVTFASNNYITPGNERKVGEYYVGRLDASGGHQTSLQGVVDTPGGNYLFKNVNQWGLKTYKGEGNAIYQEPDDIDRAIRSLDAEVFAFSQFDGFPAQMLPWASIQPRA